MFDQKHYIPILKWKTAEQQALERLVEKINPKEKGVISPLIQIVMPTPKSPKKGEREKTREEQLNEVIAIFKTKIQEIPKEILKAWGKDPVFIDLSLIYTSSLRIEGFDKILTIAEDLGLFLIPVINLSSDEEVQKIVCSLAKKYNHGFCLRLVSADFANPTDLFEKIHNFFTTCALPINKTDLLIDLKEDTNNEYLKILETSQQIPNLLKLRNFIFASGAFPVDLTTCKVGEKNLLPRSDWNNWISQLASKKIGRHPSFADYTIQHPIYKESVRFFAPSASIRYTLNEQWLVMRGQKGKSQQYLANAQILSGLPEFFGENFSYGDAQIKLKGKDLKSTKTGNATTWLVASVNHHLMCVISQIANLT